MSATIPVAVCDATSAPALTLDDLVLSGLSAREREVVQAYSWATRESALSIAAKLVCS